jgi:hypothetical protein
MTVSITLTTLDRGAGHSIPQIFVGFNMQFVKK